VGGCRRLGEVEAAEAGEDAEPIVEGQHEMAMDVARLECVESCAADATSPHQLGGVAVLDPYGQSFCFSAMLATTVANAASSASLLITNSAVWPFQSALMTSPSQTDDRLESGSLIVAFT